MSHGATLCRLQSELGLFCREKCIKTRFFFFLSLIHGRSCEISSACGRWSQECVELQSGCAQFCSASQLGNQSIQKIAASFWVFEHHRKIWQQLSSLLPLLLSPVKNLPWACGAHGGGEPGLHCVYTPNTTNRFTVTRCLSMFMLRSQCLLVKGSGGLQHLHRNRLNAAVKSTARCEQRAIWPKRI